MTTPPEQIAFPSWKQVDSDEFTKTYEMSFPSPLTTSFPENNTVRLKVFIPTDVRGPVPSVVILHYWGATDIELESAMAREMNNLGVAGIVMVLPYHLSRTPKGSRSGEMALQPDTLELFKVMKQSILDLRRTADWIQSRPEFDRNKIGLAGTSLGGIVASLGYGIEPRFTCGSFVLAGANLSKILWNSSKVVAQRDVLRRKGYTEERLKNELKAIEPSNYLKPDDARPSLVIAARQDTVVPPSCASELIAATGTKNAIWLDTGHYGGAFVRGRIVRTVARFFDESFRGAKFEAPPTIKSITFKFGLVYTPERNLQVAVSTDVWRANQRGDMYASAVLTPQGLQGFIGHKVSQGLSLGVVILPKKVVPGISWNVAF